MAADRVRHLEGESVAALLYRLGLWSFRRRRVVLAAWLLALVGLSGLGQALKGPSDDSFSIPGTESQRAIDLLSEQFPGTGGATARIVVAAPPGKKVTDPAYDAVIGRTIEAARKVPQTVPMTQEQALQSTVVSPDGRIGFGDLNFTAPIFDLEPETFEALEAVAEPARAAGLQVEYSGGVVATTEAHGASTELIGVGIGFLVLALAFRSALIGLLPLLTAIVGVAIGLSGITLMSGIISLNSTAPTLALMLGLAVGIDYALFIVDRHRQNLAAGDSLEVAAARAVGTAGSAVVFAGITVVIALSGLLVVGIKFLSVMGLAAAATVVVAVFVALTLVPAALGFVGKRAAPRTRPTGDGLACRWVNAVTRRPVLALGGVVLGLGVIAMPVMDLELGLPDDSSKSVDTTERRSYDLLTEGFGPGFSGPLTVVVDASELPDPGKAFSGAVTALKGLENVAAVSPAIPNPSGKIAIISVTPRTSPSSQATKDLVHDIRERAEPVREQNNVDVLVTGATAVNIDVSDKLAKALPVFLVLVVGLALLLLMGVFRSFAVPVKAVVGFLLTIASSMGLLVFVFQQGHLGGLFDVDTTSPIVSFLPILMIAILFGLAMDYEVFLVSRMREAYVHGADPTTAIRDGFAASAKVVVAAALIMIGVFGGFIFGADVTIKAIGLGLAFGVLADAFLVRMTLVPAVLALLGRSAWWLPSGLDRRMPNLDVEGAELQIEQPEPVLR